MISRKKILVLASGIVLFMVVYLISAYGFINIKAIGQINGSELTYRFYRQDDDRDNTAKSLSGDLKKLLRRGNYEINISQGNKGGFQLIEVEGWLQTSRAEVALTTEKNRAFVGQNPASCMFYTNRLFSYECGGLFTQINEHIPANDTTPTYVTILQRAGLEGEIEALVQRGQSIIALSHPFDVEGPGGHILYQLDQDLNPIKTLELTDLDHTKAYSIKPAGEKSFVIYSLSLDEIFLYPSFDEKPTRLPAPKTGQPSLKPVSLGTSNNVLTTVFSEGGPDSRVNLQDEDLSLNNVVALYNGQWRTVSIKGPAITAALYCAKDRLCVAAGDNLSVYSITSQNPKLLYKISKVITMDSFSNTLLVARTSEVLALDVLNKEAGVDYSYKNLSPCGMQKLDESKYMLCVINQNEKSALLIDRNREDADSIDKKVVELSKLKGAANVSAYLNRLFISLDLDLKYDPVLDGYVPDSEEKRILTEKVQREIQRLGIDTKKYKIDIQ